ncbi:hypothetical protein BDI4_250068 [Burkholderia diffusa]|nr:hypothetical protein BDI4_250068 [Burkholderia diffusa]
MRVGLKFGRREIFHFSYEVVVMRDALGRDMVRLGDLPEMRWRFPTTGERSAHASGPARGLSRRQDRLRRHRDRRVNGGRLSLATLNQVRTPAISDAALPTCGVDALPVFTPVCLQAPI